jgi:putative hemolysin
MTPRPELFAVPATITLEAFLELLREHNSPACPSTTKAPSTTSPASPSPTTCCRSPTIDARARTVASIQRPAAFVPETKRGTSCCARCSAKSSTCASSSTSTAASPAWSPLKTCSRDRRRHPRRARGRSAPRIEAGPQREPHGVWLVPGSFPVDQLARPLRRAAGLSDLGDGYEATTLGGLVSEIEGRIPLPGEVVLSNPPASASKSSPPPTAASSACASSRRRERAM